MKKEKETAQTTDFFHLCQQSCLPRYFPIVVCIHIIVLYISCLSRNRDQSIFDFRLVQCYIFVHNIVDKNLYANHAARKGSLPSLIAILHCVATSEAGWVWVQDTSDGRIMVAAGGGGYRGTHHS